MTIAVDNKKNLSHRLVNASLILQPSDVTISPKFRVSTPSPCLLTKSSQYFVNYLAIKKPPTIFQLKCH